MRKTAHDLHNITLTGTRTKDLEGAGDMDMEKKTVKRKKHEKSPKLPVL